MSQLSAEEKRELREDDANWKYGLFYFCPRDTAFLVPKRFGVGWTINFGSVWTLVGLVVVVALIVWGVLF